MNYNDNDFDALRRLLALKRHEIPPPGYFEDFSSNVIARIRAGEAADPAPWLFRLFEMFEARPAYPVALASSLCVLLLFGIVNIEQNPELAPTWNTTSAGVADASSADNLLAVVTTNSPSDMAPLFGVQPNPRFKPVSFSGAN